MKPITLITICLAVIFQFNNQLVFAQQKDTVAKLTVAQKKSLKHVSLESYEKFKASVKPLIAEMGEKQIVGLGEGTHGTAEFYKLRYYISRILIEEKRFNHVAFENDVTEMWLMNQQLNQTTDVTALMKKYMIGIWQNKETKELLDWIRTYNKSHKKKVSVNGIDFPVQKPDIDVITLLLKKAGINSFQKEVERLGAAANLQDEAWFGMNQKDFKVDWKLLNQYCGQAYFTADSLEQQVKKTEMETSLRSDLLLAISNLKQGFEPFKPKSKYVSRDSIMAHNTALMIKGKEDKVIIWAHNAHLGKKEIYNNAVGGTGKYLLKLFPDNYFVLGTGTAIGEFGATTDARPVNTTVMLPYKLEEPIKGSWEELLGTWSKNNVYFFTKAFNADHLVKPQRFVGYGTKSGVSLYDKVNLAELYDAFLFVKESHAPTML
ncbi:MAG: erythromycin esterase family protein [Sphingobacteriaceae bacterium]|nr:erythromycin esterase family protein [Sphingobacteriaceae bacterium]